MYFCRIRNFCMATENYMNCKIDVFIEKQIETKANLTCLIEPNTNTTVVICRRKVLGK